LLPQEVIRRKRDGGTLSQEEIQAFVRGLTDASFTEGQIAAFAMAVFFQGMTMEERIALTSAMTRSGSVLEWTDLDLPGPILDKHSTGGVGDKVSLMLAPIVAACGGFVPMISGRGLGHTGGTLDKLDTIPGYRTAPEPDLFRRAVSEAGCAIIGQTEDLAPADRRLYAIRDVTATVESIPLITASILSKKLAAGLQGLVMDVKTGSGAFAATLEMARELAESIVAVANGAGLPTSALITDMNQVLGSTVGNALEVKESLAYLRGEDVDPRLHDVVMNLAAEMLCLGGLSESIEEARTRAERAHADGSAAERFARMVAVLGGPTDILSASANPFLKAPVVLPCPAPREGYISAVETRKVGVAVVELGGGRKAVTDSIDPTVGLTDVCALGAPVGAERPLALIHAATRESAERAVAALQNAIEIGDEKPAQRPIVLGRLGRASKPT